MATTPQALCLLTATQAHATHCGPERNLNYYKGANTCVFWPLASSFWENGKFSKGEMGEQHGGSDLFPWKTWFSYQPFSRMLFLVILLLVLKLPLPLHLSDLRPGN